MNLNEKLKLFAVTNNQSCFVQNFNLTIDVSEDRDSIPLEKANVLVPIHIHTLAMMQSQCINRVYNFFLYKMSIESLWQICGFFFILKLKTCKY